MSETRPLAIWGEPLPGDMELLKAAKAALDLPFLIAPVLAMPGGPTRVLALRSLPGFACEYALIKDPSNPEALLAGMRWVLDPSVEDTRASGYGDWLSAVLGDDVVEVDK